MSIFNFGKKKEKDSGPHRCGCGTDGTEAGETALSVKVLGAGCPSCHKMHENAKEAACSAGFPVKVEYVGDLKAIMGYGVMSLPALVVDGSVVSAGKLLSAQDIAAVLRNQKETHNQA